MCHWLDEHPEAKAKMMRDHMKILNKFGFDVHYKLTSKQEHIKGMQSMSIDGFRMGDKCGHLLLLRGILDLPLLKTLCES